MCDLQKTTIWLQTFFGE